MSLNNDPSNTNFSSLTTPLLDQTSHHDTETTMDAELERSDIDSTDNNDNGVEMQPPVSPPSPPPTDRRDDLANLHSHMRESRRGVRPSHLTELINAQRRNTFYMDKETGIEVIDAAHTTLPPSPTSSKDPSQRESLSHQTDLAKRVLGVFNNPAHTPPDKGSIEIRLRDVSFMVPMSTTSNKIKTVYNQSFIYKVIKFFRKGTHKPQPTRTRHALHQINLSLHPGKMYLVLGPPGSGKTSLLKAIAGLLPPPSSSSKKIKTTGRIEYNGLPYTNSANLLFSNAISFISQTDNHAPRLTVSETLAFAFAAKSGGTHRTLDTPTTPAAKQLISDLDRNNFRITMINEALGLQGVADTFVGNADVRGVSGGQRRRVSVGEMMMWGAPVLCGDEISTGLDATSTYEILQSFKYFTGRMKLTRVFSLLQPSPETYSLFDEVIVLSEGEVIYAGPIEDAEDYFTSMGYVVPEQMDVADFLQTISTPYGEELFRPTEERDVAYGMKEMAEAFRKSRYADRIREQTHSPWRYDWRRAVTEHNGSVPHAEKSDVESMRNDGLAKAQLTLKHRYQNSYFKSIWINYVRHLKIWIRDKRFVIANLAKNLIMGLSVGAVFFQTDSLASLFGVLFQGMLFIMLGSMTSAPNQIDDRVILYKHQDANFYPTSSFVIGRALALIPQCILDCTTFGTMIYWMVGLETAASNFFIFLAVLVTFTLAMNQMLGIFATFSPTRATVQAFSAFILLLLVLFCGFIVTPDVIPNYYTWLYWWNPLAWAYRALLLNEFLSPSYDYMEPDAPPEFSNYTMGEIILLSKGFYLPGREPYTTDWIGYCFAYLIPYILVCLSITTILLSYCRVSANTNTERGVVESVAVPSSEDKNDVVGDVEDDGDEGEAATIDVPFIPVTLSFENICYTVKASTGHETLNLLTGVNGIFKSGRMCALMGSSGAGKTTLMDVIALRKNTGTITGEVRLNGHLQEPTSFRRCSGYVEQFDVQSPELTVRETILFSANMRLEINDIGGEDNIAKFVDHIIRMLELKNEEHLAVGTDETGGLSFEQKKRLSIAVELAASPSVLFLDEPTSGLDARAALVVMRSLKRICDTGRTICATIHQPSLAVFQMFDDLLLLKKGGEVVFFGELGEDCEKMIDFFESRGSKPLNYGENPGTWMLNVIGKGHVPTTGEQSPPNATTTTTNTDYAAQYKASKEYTDVVNQITALKKTPDPSTKIEFQNPFATSYTRRNMLVNDRLVLIYWRSPTYNLSRLMLSILIAFILASVFIKNRKPAMYTETEMSSILSTIFISFIIIGVLSITSVLPVMLSIRNMFYRHRASGMIGHSSLAMALGVAEKRFILLSSMLFCVVFYFTLGLAPEARKFFSFWGFFTFNLAIYSYFGQAFMCLVPGMATAQILASVFIGLNNFFSGLIVRPQYLQGFWQTTYWITPGHYVFEGLVVSQFYDDETPVEAYPGSLFFESLNCTLAQNFSSDGSSNCIGTASDYIDEFFGGRFNRDNLLHDILILGFYLTFARVLTYFALKKFNYAST